MTPRLDEMPSIILSLILNDIQISSPKTLLCLCLVNMTCYEAPVPYLYRTFSLKVSSRLKLREDTARLLREGRFRDNFLAYVRCIKIWRRMPTLAEEEEVLEEVLGDDDGQPAGVEEYDAEFGEVFTGGLPDGSADEIEEAWASLTLMIQRFRYITDLIWVCQNQLPPCLLRTLNQYHPSCRLDIRSFRLRSLRDPITDSHELDLIQSPHVYSISVKTVGMDSNGDVDYNKSAIFPVVALGPNLRHLNIVTPRTGASPQLLRARNTPPVPWKGFVPPVHATGRGVLSSLAYIGRRDMSLAHFQEWPRYTDLSKLRLLNLGIVSDPLVLRFLVQNVRLVSLKRFHVNLKSTADNYGLLTSELEILLETLEPLEEIALDGSLTTSLVDKAIQHHFQALRRLAINPYQHPYSPKPWLQAISPDEILKIESECSRLEYLKISIPYLSAADARDLSVLCPNIRRLKELTLFLVDSGISEAPPTKTAQEIWNLIEMAKAGCQINRLILEDSNITVVIDGAYMKDQNKAKVVAINDYNPETNGSYQNFMGFPLHDVDFKSLFLCTYLSIRHQNF